MKKLSSDIVYFFRQQAFVIVSTLDSQGSIHCSAKGIVRIEEKGKVCLVDLYRGHTFKNLKESSTISITSTDEAQFIGYTLKGKASIVCRDNVETSVVKDWEKRVIQRISKRLIKNVRKDKKTSYHPESQFPHFKYLIEMEVEAIVDLSPAHLKRTER